MERIIFLDIDGPVIPGHLYASDPVCSYYRTSFCDHAIRRLNQLCQQTGALIVTNSMQNYETPLGADLRTDLVQAGVLLCHFHRYWRTDFPDVDYAANPSKIRGWGRWLAIADWQRQHGPADWICFDDRIWTTDPRLIAIDFHSGIVDQSVQRARAAFGSGADPLALSL